MQRPDPLSSQPFPLSRTKLELFLRCPRCFFLDRRFGIAPPSGPPFTLNSAVDALLKKEFDAFRIRGEPHPLMKNCSIDAVPFRHPSIEEWRNVRRGIRALHEDSNFLFFGAIDDLWINPEGSLHIVDYKATSFDGEVLLEGPWKDGYKRQLEMYQWLFRKNGFAVSPIGYFVYVNADRNRASFEGSLHFTMSILPHRGDDSWVDDALRETRLCLEREQLPLANSECEVCAYRKAANDTELMMRPSSLNGVVSRSQPRLTKPNGGEGGI
ncbi:PD-(D/E)XK nuclease family protein [Candidatus Peregrinibacteria bacterium]|nr:PD-(D/E)XK nuclease family protein [Candidatus Peregrinibacteria bacterium]MBI3816991.1 PD-(D/E)XK nuclease family protein [Candidatus Peregrinibacteria bacterium]